MKKFMVAALAVGGLFTAGGCSVNEAEIDVLWVVSGETAEGFGCADFGATGVEVVTERIPSGSVEIDIYDCSRGGALVPRSPGDYDIWLYAIDDFENILAESVVDSVFLESSGDVVLLDEFAFD